MPTLNRASNERELKKLVSIFLKAETDIINEIGRLRSQGLVDYHAVASLERIQNILRKLENDSWEYVPKMIERQFYVRLPEARKITEPVAKHITGYGNAAELTGEQHAIVDTLVMNLMGEITDASMTAMATLQSALLGHTEPDVYRRVGLEQVAAMQAMGKGVNPAIPDFVEALRREGVTAFVDKAGRNWSLHTYGSMVLRTTSRQAEVLAVLTADPEHDLYKISSHGTTCPLCAPYEGACIQQEWAEPGFSAIEHGIRESGSQWTRYAGQHMAEHSPELPACAPSVDACRSDAGGNPEDQGLLQSKQEPLQPGSPHTEAD